ncbi:MAG: peptidylprolyl isomerase, partial [Candidatus Fermentibacteraceae bacterium]|nr:peptidylprolyl isomerase [Candidatus Fermentibacteraceae bacterium]
RMEWNMRYILIITILLLLPAASLAEVLATVNGTSLTWDEIVQMIGGEQNAQFLGITSLISADEVLRSWVREEIMVLAAESNNLESIPEVAYAIEQSRRQILLEVYMGDIVADLQPSQLEIENYVDEWLDTYKKSIHARHIIVQDENLANSLLARLRAGSDFATIALEYSVGPSGVDGGDLGWITRAQSGYMSFDEAAFRLPEGGISDIVETGVGYHIIKVVETQPLSPEPTVSEITQVVAMELTQKLQEDAVLEQVESLETQYTIVTYPERLLQHLE